MKIAVLADIHGNLVGLHTVADHIATWQPDAIVLAGDIVNRGAYPLECLRFVQQKQTTAGWQIVRGNHEEYVAAYAQPDAPRSGIEFEIFRASYWTYRQLNCEVSDLMALPFQLTLAGPDGSEMYITHASPRATTDGIFPFTTDSELRQKISNAGSRPPAVLCVGHTHAPLIRQIDNTLVVNVGSVGTPFDGDPRASYAQLTWRRNGWQAHIIRLEYDREQAARDFVESGFLAGTGPIGTLMMYEWRTAYPHIPEWLAQYHKRVLAGEMPLAKAVREFLAQR